MLHIHRKGYTRRKRGVKGREKCLDVETVAQRKRCGLGVWKDRKEVTQEKARLEGSCSCSARMGSGTMIVPFVFVIVDIDIVKEHEISRGM